MDLEHYNKQEIAKLFPDEKKAVAHLAQKHKMTADDYMEMEKTQGSRCKICGTHKSQLKRRLNIDHCHITGKIRGLLCTRCNIALGFIENSNLDRMLSYVKDNNETTLCTTGK